MRFRECIALLFYASACATSAPHPREPEARDPSIANLQRASKLPWMDDGRCTVREASSPWPVLVERCFHALDHDRIAFHDSTGKCGIASVGAAAVGLGVCVLAAPEIALGAVVITGGVVVGFAIKEALDAYALDRGGSGERPAPDAVLAPRKPSSKKRPTPEPRGPDFPPMGPGGVTEQDPSRCEPIPVPYHLGGHKLHDTCADKIPNSSFPGGDVFVNGKNFDALQLATRSLWEVKTDNFDTYSPELREFVLVDQLPKLQHERALALACGFDFKIGVRSAAHRAALLAQDISLDIVVMDWC
ncbi:DUF6310 domain-containing protein [Archangium primigenium]|uniref:DUF6310 domain-containing protein n=1 Tax=[Archangium] primigenium TaxID=2792470 RepID=UPI0019595B12|nr:DUF6310 domain-containing protein [Archangium primigenium]MBM7113933.1 hypothetical protein [Archangium primigenium]